MNQIGPGQSCSFCGGAYGEHDLGCRYAETERAKNAVTSFISKAQLAALDRYEAALWKLARMTWREQFWHGNDVVQEALQIGKYCPHPSPKE